MDYLSWPDYLILVAFFVISVGIGVYHALTGGRQKTTSEFIMANRSLKVLPTALSLLVSFQSAILILGMTAEMYSYGSLVIVLIAISIVLAIILTMQVAIPWMYPLKLVSVNEYFERRFHSKAVRMLAATISILSGVLYIGTAMSAPSTALQAATGLPVIVSIPVMAIVSVAYTALGGMRAVIWTDVFQSVVMFGGLFGILIKGLIVVGGFSGVMELCSQSGRLIWTEWSPDPTVRHSFWGFVFGHSLAWFKIYGLSQSAVQRYSATKTQSQAKLTVFLNLPAYLVLHLVVCFIGLTVVSYYTSIGCDPLTNHEVGNANQLLPRFVLQMFADAPGFAGLFLATLYGGALSSVSSSLSGAAANCWEDILQWKLMHWTESRKALLNRFLVLVFGVVGTGLAFMATAIPGPITQVAMSLSGASNGPIFGLFILGGLNRHANWKGALIGGITSLIGSFWLVAGSFMVNRKHPPLPSLSTDGCMNNLTFSNYNDINSSSIFHFLDESPINGTMTYFLPRTNQTIELFPGALQVRSTFCKKMRHLHQKIDAAPLQGLEKFYSISYVWYVPLWMLVTVFVGSLASFLLRDRTVEEKVDESLLINFRQFFRCRGGASESDSVPKMKSIVNYKTPVLHQAEASELMKPSKDNNSKALAKETPPTPKETNTVANGTAKSYSETSKL